MCGFDTAAALAAADGTDLAGLVTTIELWAMFNTMFGVQFQDTHRCVTLFICVADMIPAWLRRKRCTAAAGEAALQ
jgi:hypothetical protein